MPKDYGVPNHRSGSGKAARVPRRIPPTPPTRVPPQPQAQVHPHPPRPQAPAGRVPTGQVPASLRPNTFSKQPLPQPRSPYGNTPPTPPPERPPGSSPQKQPFFLSRWASKWQFWVLVTVFLFSGVGFFSAALLLKLPALPNCPAIFWPTASASLRLYCAQVAANKQTVDNLLEAIDLVNSLPDDHPLRPEVNRHIEEWSQAILDLAEDTFNAGELDEAIQIAKRIPANTSAHQLIAAQIQRWEEIWDEAESIYAEAEDALRQQDLRQAFSIATRLLAVDNTYWETTKYQELNNLITSAREDGAKIVRARSAADRGGLANLLEALKLAEGIKAESFAYSEAQKVIQEVGRKMMDLAEAALDRQDAQEAISIAQQVPQRANIRTEVEDFTSLARAYERAWYGTVSDLESAIVQAQKIRRGRPLYSRAQSLVSRWQLEIRDVRRLEMARQLAQPRDVGSLSAAIAELQLIPQGNPRYSEAQSQISRWTSEVQTVEDRPYLDQAEQLALGGDVTSLQAAVDTASRIREGRALYSEAQQRIQSWTSRIQRIQDQPYLDRARQLANAGDVNGAIATAEQIQAGRVLYDDAQAEVRTWRNQIRGRDLMQEAYRSASGRTSSALLNAIRSAEQVPDGSASRSEADRMINAWSREILQLAEAQAVYDLSGAIDIAGSIPPRTDAYASAQLQIETWRQMLNSEPEELPEF